MSNLYWTAFNRYDSPRVCVCVCWPQQNKASVEKTKQALESERNELQIELKSLSDSKNDSEQRRKKAESSLQELNIKHTESERQRQDLASKVAKMQVSRLRHLS